MKIYKENDISALYTDTLHDYIKQGYALSFNGNNTSVSNCPIHCNIEKGNSKVFLAVESMDLRIEFNYAHCYRVVSYESVNGCPDIISVYGVFYGIDGISGNLCSSVFTVDYDFSVDCTRKRINRRENRRNHLQNKFFLYHRAIEYYSGNVSEGLKNSLLSLIRRERGFKKSTWNDVNWVEKCGSHKYAVQMRHGKGYKELLIGF